MKKILWLLLPLLLLAACGKEPVPETAPPTVEVEIPYVEETQVPLPYEGVELYFRSIWQKTDPLAQVTVQAAQQFERTTGAVVKILWPGEEAKRVDIFQISAADFEALGEGTTLDLTEMAEKIGYTEKSHEALRTEIETRCGYLGAVAQVPYLGGIYYNADVFTACGITKMPATWEEFVETSRILREKGWVPLTLDKEDAVAAMELHLRRILGNEEMVRLMGKKAQWHFEQPVTDALELVMLYVQGGNMAFGTPADYPGGQNKMGISNSAMMVGTNADCADVEAATMTTLRWGVFPYPGQMESGTWITADMVAISPDCKDAQAAFDFVMLLVTGEFDQLRVDIGRGIPADPANVSAIEGALEAIAAAPPHALGIFGEKQTDVATKLWSAWYDKPNRYAIALERSK